MHSIAQTNQMMKTLTVNERKPRKKTEKQIFQTKTQTRKSGKNKKKCNCK